MTPEERKASVIQFEGQMLQMAGNFGARGSEQIRLIIDGAMNAIIRSEGAEAAAEFAFAVSDRVAGGLRMPTDIALPKPAPAKTVEAAVTLTAERRPRQIRFSSIFLIGWLCGFAVGLGAR